MSIDPRELTLTIGVGVEEHSTYGGTFLERTWKIESIPYKFILPLHVVLSTSDDGYLDICQPLPKEECAFVPRPPHPEEEIPELRVCSREDPCQHYEGDCASVGDGSCADDLGTILTV